MVEPSPFFQPSQPHRRSRPLRPGADAAMKDVTVPIEHKSSVLGTTANLVNAIVGCGIVGMPYAIAQCGMGAGICLMILVAIATEKSLRMLIEMAQSVHANTYEVLAESCFGSLGFRFVAINMLITAYGAMVSYLMIVKDCFAGLLLSDTSDTTTMRRSLLVIISIAIVFPLSCRRDMADLAQTSRVNVLIDGILVGIVAMNGLYSMEGTAAPEEALPLVHWNTIFVGLGVISFAFVCQHSAFIIAGSLEYPERWNSVTSRALSICLLMALTCGICGYLGFRDATKGNVLDNLDVSFPSTHIAKSMLGITMLLVYPLESFVARHVCIVLLFTGRAAHEGDDAYILNRRDRRFLLTLLVYVSAILPAAFFEDLGPVLALTGAIGGSCLSYIGPGAAFLGVHGDRFLDLVEQSWFWPTSAPVTANNTETGSVRSTNASLSVSIPTGSTNEETPLVSRPNDKRFSIDSSRLSFSTSVLWNVTAMPLWVAVARIGSKGVQAYAQDLAMKSPHPIRIGCYEYPNNPLIRHQGGTTGFDGQKLHHLIGQKLQVKKSPFAAQSPALDWHDFFVAIGFVIFGVVAMFAGIASLFVEENGR